MNAGRDLWYHELMAKAAPDCAPRGDERRGLSVHALHERLGPAKPKGVVHSTAGYLLHTPLTTKYIFDIQ